MGRIDRARSRRSLRRALLAATFVAAVAASSAAASLSAHSFPRSPGPPPARTFVPPVTSWSPTLVVRGDFLSEGFEDTTFPPAGWTYTPVHPTSRWTRTSAAAWVRSGVGAALIRTQSVSVQDEKLVSLPMDVSA